MPYHPLVDPLHPDTAILQEAVAILRRGGMVAYLTDTVGGLVGLAPDTGVATSAVVSTIVDMTVEPPALCRAGKIPVETFETVLRCKIHSVAKSVETVAPLRQEKKI